MLNLPTFLDLREFVRAVLCARADLDPSTPMDERTLLRRDRPCGIEYTMVPGRSVRLSAIWDAGQKRIFFYDQNLERFQVSRVQGPDALEIEDRPRERVALARPWQGR